MSNPQEDPQPSVNPNTVDQLDISTMGVLEDTSNMVSSCDELTAYPTRASMMDWTERLIELTLSTDNVSVDKNDPCLASTRTSQASGSFDATFASFDDISSSVNVVSVTDTGKDQMSQQLQGGPSSVSLQENELFLENESNMSRQSVHDQIAPQLLLSHNSETAQPIMPATIDIDLLSSTVTSDVWNPSRPNLIFSWATEKVGVENESTLIPMSSSYSFEKNAFNSFSLPDHQYSSPLRENAPFPFESEGTSDTPSSSNNGTHDSRCKLSSDVPHPEHSYSIDEQTWPVEAEVDITQCASNPSHSAHLVPLSAPVSFSGTSSTENNVFDAFNSTVTPLDPSSCQNNSNSVLSGQFNDHFQEETNQTMLDISDAFIDYATVEVDATADGFSKHSLGTSNDQFLQDQPPLSASYSGTVTICRAEDIPASLSNALDQSSWVPSTAVGPDLQLNEHAQPSDKSYDSILISDVIGAGMALTEDIGTAYLGGDYSSQERQSEEQARTEAVTLNSLLSLSEEDLQSYAIMSSASNTFGTLEAMSTNALLCQPDSDVSMSNNSQNILSDMSYSFSQSANLTSRTFQTGAIASLLLSSTSTQNVDQTPTERAFSRKGSTHQPRTSAFKKSTRNPFFTTSSRPVPSELFTDALLSPGDDVFRTFTPAGPSSSKSSLSRTISDASDASVSDSDVSRSSSLASKSHTTEGESSGKGLMGNNLKDTLRSRLKAKRKAAGLSEDIVEKEDHSKSCSGSTTPDSLSSVPQAKRLCKEPLSLPGTSQGGGRTRSLISNISSDRSFDESDGDDSSDDQSIGDHDNDGTQSDVKTRAGKSKQNEPESEEARLAKREKNKLAARKCRHKKNDKIESLTKQVQKLEEKQGRIKTEIDKMEMEREQLQEMLRLHTFVCPMKRKDRKTEKK